MFACFAQMRYNYATLSVFQFIILTLFLIRVCHLLEVWIKDYPNDFAVKGTTGALSALVNSINLKTPLLHYGSEFGPFLDQLPNLKEENAAWALKADIVDTDSEDYYESEDDETRVEPNDPAVNDADSTQALSFSSVPSKERKPSVPSTKALFSTSQTEPTPKQLLKDLVKLANEVLAIDSDDIAKEITRQGVAQFLKIKVFAKTFLVLQGFLIFLTIATRLGPFYLYLTDENGRR